jgi:hypothetical protein
VAVNQAASIPQLREIIESFFASAETMSSR